MSPQHGNQQPVRRANLANTWPFTVGHGTLTCRSISSGPLLLFTTPAGHTYALNDLAEAHGYPSIQPIRNGFSLGVEGVRLTV